MRGFTRRTKTVAGLLAVIVLAGLQTAPHALAKPPFLEAFVARYPASTNLFTCGTCHYDFNGPQDDIGAAPPREVEILNAYGRAFSEAGGQDDAAAALAAIENGDADGDGTSNVDEIVTPPGFLPGYDCESYLQAVNAPASLAFYVDPGFVGCGFSTTSTLAATTTLAEATTTTAPAVSSTSTSTTLPAPDHCAQPRSNGALPTASDCLFILRAALGSSTCSPACTCAPKGTLPITATDSLICLKRAIGQNITLHCPCDGVTTTTEQAPTTTLSATTTTLAVTTTAPVPTTTTVTSTTSTTATTLGGSVQVGQAIYDSRCSACHIAGAHDKSGFAPNLKGKGGLLVNNLSSINPMMAGITLTNQEIMDLAAFFDSL